MIKIGIVGTGGIAEWHVNEFQKNKDSTVVAACDVSSERLNTFCDKFNIKEKVVIHRLAISRHASETQLPTAIPIRIEFAMCARFHLHHLERTNIQRVI